VAFLLGCSFTFEWALLDAGIDLWHVKHGKNVAMWPTSIECRPAGVFHGPMVVSMRPIPTAQLSKAVTASARFPNAHGGAGPHRRPEADRHRGHRDAPGGAMRSTSGPATCRVFWACGVTPQAVALKSKPPFWITHSPRLHVHHGHAERRRSPRFRFVPAGAIRRSRWNSPRRSASKGQHPGPRARILIQQKGRVRRRGDGARLPRAPRLLRSASVTGYEPLVEALRALAAQTDATVLPPPRHRRDSVLLRRSGIRLRPRRGRGAASASRRTSSSVFTRPPTISSTSSASRRGCPTWPCRAAPTAASGDAADEEPPGSVRAGRRAVLHLLGGEPGRVLVARSHTAAPLRSGAAEPTLLRAGDRVRCGAIDRAEFDRIAGGVDARTTRRTSGDPDPRARTARHIQDGGRTGQLRYGIPPSGPMDVRAFVIAHRLVGNADRRRRARVRADWARASTSSTRARSRSPAPTLR
jgi:hypothetical protein